MLLCVCARVISSVPIVDAFWSTLGYLANTVIFFVAGLIVAARAASDPHLLASSLWRAVILWILLHVVRAIMLAMLWPVLSSGTYSFSVNQAMAVVYGGLRGAVGLTLALIVNEQLDEQKILLADSNPKLSENAKKLGDEILFYVAIVAFLTLLVNGTTMEVTLYIIYIPTSTSYWHFYVGIDCTEELRTVVDGRGE